jgi:hypothetical protein
MSITPPSEMLELITGLEVSLHHSAVRCYAVQLKALLHPDFAEIGRSGHSYNKAQMIEHLAKQSHDQHTVWSQNFTLAMPAYSVALLTYQSAQMQADESVTHHAARSSLWQLTDAGWQLRFHQATAVPTFALSPQPAGLVPAQTMH